MRTGREFAIRVRPISANKESWTFIPGHRLGAPRNGGKHSLYLYIKLCDRAMFVQMSQTVSRGHATFSLAWCAKLHSYAYCVPIFHFRKLEVDDAA